MEQLGTASNKNLFARKKGIDGNGASLEACFVVGTGTTSLFGSTS
jgi:hypothetical protein